MPSDPAQFDISGVAALNNGLQKVVSNATSSRLAFLSTEGSSLEALRDSMPGKSFSFEMRGAGATGRATQGDRAGNVYLAPLRERSKRSGPYHVWVAGLITWAKLPGKVMELITLNWSFFGGRERPGENMMLLRAEWYYDRSHPQPHWHFHDDVFVPRFGGDSESPNDDPAVASLSRVHLPMAGWTNDTDYPSCWSHRETFEPTVLVDWSARILQVAADQLDYLLDKSGV